MRRKRSDIFSMRYSRWILIVSCIVCIVNIIMPDKSISESENRSLQTFPEVSLHTISDGELGNSLTHWFSDQFVGRNAFIHFRYGLLKLTGTKEINHVFLTHDSLYEDINKANTKQLKRNIKAINAFASSNDVNTTFVLAPTAANVYKENLPYSASTVDQNKQMDSIYKQLNDNVHNVDVRKVLDEHKNAYLYYHTDHHWTTMGAYYAFSQVAEELDIDAPSLSNYTIYPVSSDFHGTLSNATGSVGITDEIDIFVPEVETQYLVTNQSTGEKSRTVYQSKALETRNPYEVFLSGNSSMINIEMNNDSDKHLLILKDSYANCFIPFLLPYYRTITVVDPRYYYDDLSQVIKNELITDVLFLYNTNTFVQDTSLADVLE